MVGMGVGLERPLDRVAGLPRGGEDGLDRADIHLAGFGVVVEHRVDDGCTLGRRIGDQIAERVRCFVEESADSRLA